MEELLILFFLLVLSALFSGSETALVALSVARAESLLEEERTGARALYILKSDPSRMLITILIGNNLVNIGASALATVVATDYFGQLGPGIAVGILTVLVLIFGEITPKSLATRYAERISLAIAPVMLLIMKLLYPLVILFAAFTSWVHARSGGAADPTVTESELINLLGHGVREGQIESDKHDIIKRVFDFGDLTVGDVMTPRQKLHTMDGTLRIKDALPEFLAGTHSRIPVYDDNPDDLKVIVTLRDILKAVTRGETDKRLLDVGTEALYVYANQPLDEMFATLRDKQRQIALAVDEHGELQGLVTVEDLLEELVGEIYDEIDISEDTMRIISENEILADGELEIRAIEETFAIELPGKPTDTVSLWILEHLGEIPEVGQTLTIDSLTVTIKKASERHIQQVLLSRQPLEDGLEPADNDSHKA